MAHIDMAWLNPSKPDGRLPDEPTYDMVLTVDAVHDVARPDQVLPLVRKVSSIRPPSRRQPRPVDHPLWAHWLQAFLAPTCYDPTPESGMLRRPSSVRVLRRCVRHENGVQQALKPDGGYLVFDMRGNATPAENCSDPQVAMLAPILYGFSVHICLPSGNPPGSKY